MGGGGGRQTASSQSTATIPSELSPLFSQTGTTAQQFQQAAPLAPFLAPSPFPVAGLSPTQQFAIGQLPALTQRSFGEQAGQQALLNFATGDIGQSPAVLAALDAFQSTVEPRVQNQLALAGLGNSGALGQELQSAFIGQLQPLFQQGLQQQQAAATQLADIGSRENQRVGQQIQLAQQLGQVQQAAEQARINQIQQDFLRRQALAEQALFGPLGQFLPTAIGQTTTSSTPSQGGGLFK